MGQPVGEGGMHALSVYHDFDKIGKRIDEVYSYPIKWPGGHHVSTCGSPFRHRNERRSNRVQREQRIPGANKQDLKF